MWHRMTMRVVPALTVAVTDEEFRRRKRILMVFPWLIAFALYRGLKAMAWHDDIIALLLSSGLYSSVVALGAYAYGRERRGGEMLRGKDPPMLARGVLRIGVFYSVLPLLVVL